MPIKILLLGKKFSGKTTVANYLKTRYGLKEYAFADPLKEVCKTLFDLSNDQLHNHEHKEKIDERWKYSPRQIFQITGDIIKEQIPEYFKSLNGYNMFIKLMESRIKNENLDIVISDGRFPDEIEWFKTQDNGYVVKIVRSGINSSDTHMSETYDYIDPEVYIINNDKTLEDLYLLVDDMMSKIG